MKKQLTLLALFISVIASSQQFQNPLYIPDTLMGKNFQLFISDSSHQFIPGVNTSTMGYNGSYMGPILIFEKNATVNISVVNALNEGTTVHWHGMEVEANVDGGPHNIIDDSSSWFPSFKVRDNAATMWYHSHLHKQTQRQVNMGLAGMIIIRDSSSKQLSIPSEYGKDDFPIILQDKTFDSLGQINNDALLGDTFLINGTLSPYLNTPAQNVRFRLLNASIQRIYNIGFEDNRDFQVIATDNGFLESPVKVNRLMIASGERYEIVADFTNDLSDTLALVNYSSEMGYGFLGGIPGGDVYPSPLNGVDKDLMKLRITAPTANKVDSISTVLTTHVIPSMSSVSRERYKKLGGKAQGGNIIWNINNTSFSMSVINDTVISGSTEIWEIRNSTHFVHPFHIHSGHFFLIENDSMPPTVIESGKKDVILVRPNTTVKFIMEFPDFHDAQIPYMYHCHMLDHEDGGMMAQFIIVDSSYLMSTRFPEANESINVWPNPVDGFVRFEIELADAKWQIHDLKGRLITKGDCRNGVNQIETTKLFSGSYILSISTDKGTSRTRFIKI
ncbi:MAG: multicopper oxidase domain-containing protein [Chitinophagales bacterium]|nr:multicopper oxidase domain-containing protein [Chitinophagales bacterium]